MFIEKFKGLWLYMDLWNCLHSVCWCTINCLYHWAKNVNLDVNIVTEVNFEIVISKIYRPYSLLIYTYLLPMILHLFHRANLWYNLVCQIMCEWDANFLIYEYTCKLARDIQQKHTLLKTAATQIDPSNVDNLELARVHILM